MSDDPGLKAAYQHLEDAILDVARLEGFDGVLVEWVVLTTHRHFDDEGDGVNQYGKLLLDGIPHHHVMGLLDSELCRLRAQAAEPDE